MAEDKSKERPPPDNKKKTPAEDGAYTSLTGGRAEPDTEDEHAGAPESVRRRRGI